MDDQLSYAFTVFFLTLGPIKTIPGFAAITADLDAPARRWLAMRGTLLATLIVFATALIFLGTMKGWRISVPAMQIAGGLLLFASASNAIAKGVGSAPTAAPTGEPPAPKPLTAEVKARALSPLTVPILVTPIGLVAILVFGGASEGDPALRYGIYGLLAAIMAMNLVGMTFARGVMKVVGLPTFRLLGWIMSVLQAGLAVQAVISALRALKVIPV